MTSHNPLFSIPYMSIVLLQISNRLLLNVEIITKIKNLDVYAIITTNQHYLKTSTINKEKVK